MRNYICVTCGVQYAATSTPPSCCPICEDERQYIHYDGQQWTTLEDVQRKHHNIVESLEPHLTGIGTKPAFAIGQRALLVETSRGNILWDCITLINDETVKKIEEKGGIDAIAISHPHYYATMVEWSQAFGNVPIYLHSKDRAWVQRSHNSIRFWEGDTFSPWEGITLICCGGHFAGGTVLHWKDGAQGKGALLTGDIIDVVADRCYVTFMYSYPNAIPMSAAAVNHILEVIEPFEFNRVYGAWWERYVLEDGKRAIQRSAQRYKDAISGKWQPALKPSK